MNNHHNLGKMMLLLTLVVFMAKCASAANYMLRMEDFDFDQVEIPHDNVNGKDFGKDMKEITQKRVPEENYDDLSSISFIRLRERTDVPELHTMPSENSSVDSFTLSVDNAGSPKGKSVQDHTPSIPIHRTSVVVEQKKMDFEIHSTTMAPVSVTQRWLPFQTTSRRLLTTRGVIFNRRSVKFECVRGVVCEMKFTPENSNIKQRMSMPLFYGVNESEVFMVAGKRNTLVGVPMVVGVHDFLLHFRGVQTNFSVTVKESPPHNHVFQMVLYHPTEYQIMGFLNTRTVFMNFLANALNAPVEIFTLLSVGTTARNRTEVKFFVNSLDANQCENRTLVELLKKFNSDEVFQRMVPDFNIYRVYLGGLEDCLQYLGPGKSALRSQPQTQKSTEVFVVIVSVTIVIAVLTIGVWMYKTKETRSSDSPDQKYLLVNRSGHEEVNFHLKMELNVLA
ncbi:CRE-DGN-3 protein [Caenorhabditis remanei]|uniref:CRE-DGN-3 protein n=1 Tax=Caenorhabditis remanei TaxID=31234 RepID=E3MLF7_CAERE|nr:CRE-DGN-3 protein [Caenorhabditis remanei]